MLNQSSCNLITNKSLNKQLIASWELVLSTAINTKTHLEEVQVGIGALGSKKILKTVVKIGDAHFQELK